MTRRRITDLILIGDSDIDRWPKKLYPSISSSLSSSAASSGRSSSPRFRISGHGGYTLQDIVPYIEQCLFDTPTTALVTSPIPCSSNNINNNKNNNKTQNTENVNCVDGDDNLVVLVVCAGENDIGNGLSLEKSENAMKQLIQSIFEETFMDRLQQEKQSRCRNQSQSPKSRRLIFLGPKIEPWLQHDPESRKQYIRMSHSFERLCKDYNNQININNNKHEESSITSYIHYIDCLTMFCNDKSRDVPGALYGGKAIADKQYFHSDGLHLSDDGYQIWKHIVEQCIQEQILFD